MMNARLIKLVSIVIISLLFACLLPLASRPTWADTPTRPLLQLTVSPPTATTGQGTTITPTVGWFDSRQVFLQAPPPPNVTIGFNPPVGSNFVADMRINVGSGATPGTYLIPVMAYSTTPVVLLDTFTFTLVITNLPPFTPSLTFDPGPWQAPKESYDIGLWECENVCRDNDWYGLLDPVYLHNGEFILEETDLKIPGRGLDYEFHRTYKNQIQYAGPLGHNWQHNYDMFLLQSGNNITLVNGYARADVYTSTNGITFTAPAGFYTQLTKNGDGTYTLRNPHGSMASFNALDNSAAQGRLTRLADRNGNTLQYQYDGLGRLVRVSDTYSRPITYTYGVSNLLAYIEDFTGRRVNFGYVNGDLITVTSPAVTGTPHGNDFPNGKSWRYSYSSGFGDERLNHNLLTMVAPNEVANATFTPRVTNTYGTTGYDFDRVTMQVWGGTNANGVPAGGTITLTYQQLNLAGDPNDLTLPRNRTIIVDRNGDQKTFEHNVNGHRLSLVEASNRDVRPTDVVSWTLTTAYNRDGKQTSFVNAQGNQRKRSYNTTSAERLQQANLLIEVRIADARGGDQAILTTTRTYEPIYNQLRTLTEPRGHDPNYVPANGGTRTPARYTITYTFDYEEGCDYATLGAKIGRSASEAQQLLSAAGMCAAPLGDVNGDGLTNTVSGNVIRIQRPSVALLAGSQQATVEGTTTQPIVELYWYNAFGQKIREVDPEGNVMLYDYYAERDPDGNGTIDNPNGNATTGGYVNRVTTDALMNPIRNSQTNPMTTSLRMEYQYDARGNVVRHVDGRGIATDYTVNALNQIVQVTHAAAHAVYAPEPAEPVALSDFQYSERIFYDANNNVVLKQIEDRGNTSSVDGNPPSGDVPLFAPNPDPVGGTAYVDTVYKYDILDRRIEMVQEVSNSNTVTEFLRTRYRYDPNGHEVLVIQPAGNATTAIYDERGLLFQRIRGATTRPPLAQMGASDPITFDVRGGLSATTTYHYDFNRNLIEVVDASDNDSSAANNSTLGGVGDRTRYIYDGFDRRTSVVDSVGNQVVYQYDARGNTVRTVRFGPNGGASPTSNGPASLLMPVSSHGVIQAGNLVSANLLEATTNLYDELSRLIQIDRALFVAVTTTRALDVLDGASDIGKGDLTPSDTCALSGVTAPASGYLGCVSTRYAYDRNSRQTFVVEDDGDVTRTYYDGANRIIKIVDPVGNSAETAYDDNHNVIETRETDVSQKTGVANEVFLTTYFYDSLDRLQRRVDNVGQTMEYRYDSRNNRVAYADANGPISGNITRRAFTGGALTMNTINQFGNVTVFYYDGLNREVRREAILTASGLGDGVNSGASITGTKTTTPTADVAQGGGDGVIRTGNVWDANSLLSAKLDDQGNVTLYTYDNLNRRVVEAKGLTVNTTPLNKTKVLGARNVVAPTAATVNNPALIATATIDAQLATLQARLSALASLFPARADRVDDNPPTALVYGYDPDDNLLSMEDENDSETFMRYDALNRLIAVRVFRAGQSDTHASDSIFAPSPASDPSNSSATMVIGTTKQDYHYDGLSRLVRATDNNDPSDTRDDSTVTFTYDGLSRIVEELQQIDTVTRTVSSAWRAGDLRSRVTYPNNREVFYTYDALDRIKMISEVPEAITYTVYLPLVLRAAAPPRLNVPETFVRAAASVTPTTLVTFTYIGTGRVLERAYANGVTLTYLDNTGANDVGYDGAQRVTQLRHVRADLSLAVGFTQTYSRMDDKLTETKLHNTANNEVYAYDSQNRLMQFNRPHVGAVTPLHSNWKLDGVGDWQQVRSTESGTPITEMRTHSSHNEIITRTGGVTATILSDDSGNETDDGTYLFQWDFDNRLRSVTRKSDSQLIATYQYDALGRRIRKTVTNTASLNGTTDFVFAGWQIIEERDGNNQLSRQTIYGLLLDEPLILDRNLGGGTTATGANDQRLYYHHNTVGSVFGLSNQTGKLVEAYQYDAYGRVVVYAAGTNGAIDFGGDDGVSVGGASGVGNAYLFTGQRLDAETNLYHYKRRYYSPTQGRFISRDPIEFFIARSVYEYAVSNPATFVDPWGLTEYKMQAPTKVPWSNHKLKKGTHGLTVPTELSVSCRCVCCEDMKRSNNWKVECTLTLNILILMDEDQINAANKKHGGWNTTSVYGHEQKHVKAIQDAVKARVDAIDTGGCDFTKTMCPKKAKDFEKKILEAAQKGLNDGAGHDAHGHDGKPADGTPYAPDKGTDVPGLKGNEQPPKMPPKELEDFWRKAQIGGNIAK